MFKKKNLIEELIEYIKTNLKKGYTKDSLRWALINQGYSRLEVEKAMRYVDQKLAEQAPILKTKPEIKCEVISSQPEKKPWWKFFR